MLVGHASVADVPLSPLQAAQAKFALHAGVPPLQNVASVHCTQLPWEGPDATHAGLVVVGQGRTVVAPWLPVQAAQTSFEGAVLHVGLVPVQAPRLFARQVPHVFLARSQNGALAGQSALVTHPPHWLAAMTSGVHRVPPKPAVKVVVETPAFGP